MSIIRARSGFTLVEVLVALGVFAVVITAYLTLTRQAGSAAIQSRTNSEITRTLAAVATRVRLGDPTYTQLGTLPAAAVLAVVNPPPAMPVRVSLVKPAGDPPRYFITGTSDHLSNSVLVIAPGGTP